MFACLGIRDFKPHLKKAPERLDGLLTPEGDPIPANTLAEIRRAMDRLVLVRAQIKEIEDTRAEKVAEETPAWHHAMVGPAGPKLRNRTNFRTYHERRLYSEGFSLKFRCELRGGGYFDGEYWP